MKSREALSKIIEKFSVFAWDLLEQPVKEWLEAKRNGQALEVPANQLIAAVTPAEQECETADVILICYISKCLPEKLYCFRTKKQ